MSCKIPSHSFWYTNKETIKIIKKVLGSIDLDPTSSKKANSLIKAFKFFSRHNSCLDKIWFPDKKRRAVKTFFMNPPYTRDMGTSSVFIDKALKELKNSINVAGIILVNASTGSSWCQRLMKNSDAICFPNQRIAFNEDLDEVRDYFDDQLVGSCLDDSQVGLEEGKNPRYDNLLCLVFSSKWNSNVDKQYYINKFENLFSAEGTVWKK